MARSVRIDKHQKDMCNSEITLCAPNIDIILLINTNGRICVIFSKRKIVSTLNYYNLLHLYSASET